MSTVITIEAASLLGQMIGVSQLNRADMPEDRPAGEPMPPWRLALRALTERDVSVDEWDAVPCARRLFRRHTDADEQEIRVLELCPRRSFVEAFSDGDPPADLTDSKIADAATWEPEYRNRCRTHDGRVLVWREAVYDRGRGGGHSLAVRETHRTVHRALAGEDYDTRYERIKRAGGVITETTATEAQTGPTIKGCPWCKEAM